MDVAQVTSIYAHYSYRDYLKYEHILATCKMKERRTTFLR